MTMTKAMRSRQKSEAKDKPGSVIITFKDPIRSVAFWRKAKDEDYQTAFGNTGASVSGDTIVIQTITNVGVISRFYNWRDVHSVMVVPVFEKKESS